MRNLSKLMGDGKARTPEAKAKLTEAYRNVFVGGESAEIVLTDLVDYCLYFTVVPIEAGDRALVDHNARRAVFGRILHFLSLTDEEMSGLVNAARQERITNVEEGTI